MTLKEGLNKIFSGRKIPFISKMIMAFKILAFVSLIVTALALYKMGSIQWANDVLIVAAILVILNKLDNMNNE